MNPPTHKPVVRYHKPVVRVVGRQEGVRGYHKPVGGLVWDRYRTRQIRTSIDVDMSTILDDIRTRRTRAFYQENEGRPVDAARAQQRGVEDIDAVGRGDHLDVVVRGEAMHRAG